MADLSGNRNAPQGAQLSFMLDEWTKLAKATPAERPDLIAGITSFTQSVLTNGSMQIQQGGTVSNQDGKTISLNSGPISEADLYKQMAAATGASPEELAAVQQKAGQAQAAPGAAQAQGAAPPPPAPDAPDAQTQTTLLNSLTQVAALPALSPENQQKSIPTIVKQLNALGDGNGQFEVKKNISISIPLANGQSMSFTAGPGTYNTEDILNAAFDKAKSKGAPVSEALQQQLLQAYDNTPPPDAAPPPPSTPDQDGPENGSPDGAQKPPPPPAPDANKPAGPAAPPPNGAAKPGQSNPLANTGKSAVVHGHVKFNKDVEALQVGLEAAGLDTGGHKKSNGKDVVDGFEGKKTLGDEKFAEQALGIKDVGTKEARAELMKDLSDKTMGADGKTTVAAQNIQKIHGALDYAKDKRAEDVLGIKTGDVEKDHTALVAALKDPAKGKENTDRVKANEQAHASELDYALSSGPPRGLPDVRGAGPKGAGAGR